ncbi:MerR family transcriptional regulator [Thermomonospora amylolytica]|uniref:MerR family transcriptional regulator n=1 Tax=Thermomonospora amylolytica TaxID=1411117 RepID=UPI000E6CC44F|nr:MerR family transcriptional regulator [Thermomonospora amylolytica]
MSERRWKVGELVEATGLTVRALHHFDEIGLVRPAERSAAGHRLYTAADVRRLYRVLALRQLGLPLREIAASLEGDTTDLATAVHSQLEQVRQRIALQRRLQRRLAALAQALRDDHGPSIDQFLDTMEAMMQARYFTPDQLARLKERHNEVGTERFDHWRRQWTQINAEVQAHIDAGSGEADPAVQETARRWNDLMQDMTGGDPAVLAAMYAKMDGEGPQAATRGVVGAEVWDYMKRVLAVGFGSRSAAE